MQNVSNAGAPVNSDMPQDPGTEQLLLGSLLLAPEAIAQVLTEPAHFLSERHQVIFGALREAFAEHGPKLDAAMLVVLLDQKRMLGDVGGQKYLSELINGIPSAANVEFYAGVLAKTYQLRLRYIRARMVLNGIRDQKTLAELDDLAMPPDPEPGSGAMIVSAKNLMASRPNLRPVLIEGLLRRGEAMNLIASPKTGKSWLVHGLALCVATGGRWFDRQCTQGRVLIIDNELHPETMAFRLKWLHEINEMTAEQTDGFLDTRCLRGNLQDLAAMRMFFRSLSRANYSLIIIDSLYRAMPKDLKENENSDQTALYNMIDRYAEITGAAFICIHHATKGPQGQKSITDTGAGGGAQSRAVDTHAVLRDHTEEGVIVLGASVRSFPKTEPTCWRVQIPHFIHEPDLNPEDLRTERARRSRAAVDMEPKPEPWTAARFASELLSADGQTLPALEARGQAVGLTARAVSRLAEQAAATGAAYKWKTRPAQYATAPEPLFPAADALKKGKK